MRREVRDAWTAALRSGEFARTTGKLTRVDRTGTPTGYCCLGVLCELAVRAGVQLRVSDDLALGVRYYGDVDDFLPETVRTWAGVDGSDPLVDLGSLRDDHPTVGTVLDDQYEDHDHRVSLATLNDHVVGVSFDVIADAIEGSL